MPGLTGMEVLPLPNAEGRFALVIACNEYNDPKLKQLVAPPNDAEKLTEVLEAPTIGDYKVVKLVNGCDDDVKRAINAFFLIATVAEALLLDSLLQHEEIAIKTAVNLKKKLSSNLES
jgi:hypothetical protein